MSPRQRSLEPFLEYLSIAECRSFEVSEPRFSLVDREEEIEFERNFSSVWNGKAYPPAFHGVRPFGWCVSQSRCGDVRSGDGVGSEPDGKVPRANTADGVADSLLFSLQYADIAD